MKIKLDENLSRHLKVFLAQEGHDVTTAAEEGLLGKPDASIWAAAKAEGRVVFILDMDFADLRRFPPGSHPGIVLFRPRSLGPQSVSRSILAFLRETDLTLLAGCTVIVEPMRIRVRRPPEQPEKNG